MRGTSKEASCTAGRETGPGTQGSGRMRGRGGGWRDEDGRRGARAGDNEATAAHRRPRPDGAQAPRERPSDGCISWARGRSAGQGARQPGARAWPPRARGGGGQQTRCAPGEQCAARGGGGPGWRARPGREKDEEEEEDEDEEEEDVPDVSPESGAVG
ncbi:unnamed protein product [Prorocentrum cordatum]|uniref:Uncharacterized protein n=1 Tax=Prorocentrum cordatum TaxID=2364126 RepID=A0ABN9U6S8_9DINO|nr:unnamed protein product [Polarella glacialis]